MRWKTRYSDVNSGENGEKRYFYPCIRCISDLLSGSSNKSINSVLVLSLKIVKYGIGHILKHSLCKWCGCFICKVKHSALKWSIRPAIQTVIKWRPSYQPWDYHVYAILAHHFTDNSCIVGVHDRHYSALNYIHTPLFSFMHRLFSACRANAYPNDQHKHMKRHNYSHCCTSWHWLPLHIPTMTLRSH